MASNPDNTNDELLQFFSNSSSLPDLQPEETDRLFRKAKVEFYNHKEYKWIFENCQKYVKDHLLSPVQFINSLEHLFNSYFQSKTDQGQKGAFDLIHRLKKSSRFTSTNIPSHKITLQGDKNVIDFLEEMKGIQRTYLNINQKTMIKFLFDHFETGYTFKTLERKYKDQLLNPEQD